MKFFKCHSQKMKNEKIICLEDKYTDIGPDVFDGFEVEYIILADTTKIIRDYAFSGLGKCSVYLPKSVSEIEPLAFENTNPLVTFYCSNGSYAAKICNNNNLTVNYNINEIFEIVEEKKRAISGISQRMSNEQTFQEDAEENFITSNNDKKEYPDKSQKENESSISLDSSEDIFNAVDSKEQLRNDSDKKNKKQVDSTESSFFAGKEEIIFQVKSLVASASDFNELKSVYNNVNKVCTASSFNADDEIIEIFKDKVNNFIDDEEDYITLVQIADVIESLDRRILDNSKLISAIKTHMRKNFTFNGIFDVYCAFKEKQYVENEILDKCLSKATEDYILNLTASISGIEDKLVALENAYESFKLTYEGMNFASLKEIYDLYHAKFSGNTNVEAISKGNAVVNEIEKGMYDHCPIYQLKEYVKKLSEVEVEYDPILKARVSVVYKRLTQALYRQLVDTELSLKEINSLSIELLRAAKQLHDNGVYDGELRTTLEGKTYVPDGLLRFATTICELISCAKEVEDLAELLMSHDMIRRNLTHEDNTIKKLCSDYAPAIMNYWLNKNRKVVTANKLKKAIKLVKKETGNEPSRTAKGIVEEYLKYGKKNEKASGLKIVIVAVVILALLVGGIFGYKALFGIKNKDPYANAKYSISVEEKTLVDEYLEKFSVENLTDAEFVIGTLNVKEKVYILNITDNLGSTVFDGKFAVQNTYIESVSKKYIDLEKVKNGKEYAFVVQKDKKANKFYVRDVFEIPTELDKYDFEVPVKDKKTDENDEFLTAVIKYVGFQAKFVKPEER